jgi:hypothetical protein
MRSVTVGIVMGMLVFTSLLWASGGKNRHGQDGTQPRTRTGQGCMGLQQGICGLRLTPGRLEGPKADVDERGTRQRLRDRDRDRDGSCESARKQIRDRDRDRDGSCQTARKQIRDRKQDGSCQTAQQTRTRTRTRSENRTGLG